MNTVRAVPALPRGTRPGGAFKRGPPEKSGGPGKPFCYALLLSAVGQGVLSGPAVHEGADDAGPVVVGLVGRVDGELGADAVLTLLGAAVISASVLTKRLLLSGADLKGMAKPMPASPLGIAPSPPVIALRATSSVTHQAMKSRVAWMSSAVAFLLTHQ